MFDRLALIALFMGGLDVYLFVTGSPYFNMTVAVVCIVVVALDCLRIVVAGLTRGGLPPGGPR